MGKATKLSVATLAIMNVTAVVSLRGLPAEAEYGVSSAFYYLFAAIVFLIPTALVAAELAAMFSDKQGGVFRWVGEAFGKRFGFLAIWLQWFQNGVNLINRCKEGSTWIFFSTSDLLITTICSDALNHSSQTEEKAMFLNL